MDKTRLRVLQKRAAQMRLNPTEPEKRLWRALSNRQLAGAKFRRQEVLGEHILDFYCPSSKFAVEVDGDTHSTTTDAERDARLAKLGVAVVHVTNAEVMLNIEGVLASIVAELSKSQPTGNTASKNAATALREAAARLDGVSETPRLDAELLMAHAAGIERSDLLLQLRDIAEPREFAALVERRAAHEPVAYILGYRDFWTVRLKVGPGALIPRADSETLIEAAVAAFGDQGPARMLDLGCGPGTLLLAALDQWPQATGLGIERSTAARALAEENAAALGMADRAEIHAGDWTGAGWIEAIGARFDLILCNPPYVAPEAELMREVAEYEPAEALYAADAGLADYRIIIAALPELLSENGIATIELGAGQAGDVGALADAVGLAWTTRDDLGGHPRAMVLKRG